MSEANDCTNDNQLEDLCRLGQNLKHHRAGMNVNFFDISELETFETQAKNRPYMGMPVEADDPIPPPYEEFTYSEDQLLPSVYCHNLEFLIPSPRVNPPSGRSYPASPVWNYTEDHRYRSRFVYSTAYYTRDLAMHRERLMVTDTPPNVIPTFVGGRYIAEAVSGLVQMIPGVPFVYHINGDSNAAHTVACLHTLESLRPYPCFPEVLDLSVQLAKLSWGCQAHDTTPSIPRISRLPGLKRNNRSKKVSSGSATTDGSYSLANTVLEGEGQGTVLPAVQVDTKEARIQINSVLICLNRIYRLVMPLSLSKFEFDIADFHSDINNVMSFGGLMPTGTGCQLNISSLGQTLSEMIGPQGSWHTDSKDDLTRLTLFVLLLHVGPNGHPGSFCLGRPGLYVQELGMWIIFLVFKGNDIHSGFAPMEDHKDHQDWVESILAPAWDHAGPENRLGYVIYPSSIAIQRNSSLNATPSQLFGNFGASQPHKTSQLTFAKHGQVTLGDQEDWANRMGREAVGSFFNYLAHCNLDLNIDVNELLQNISFQRNQDGLSVPLKPLPHHPIKDANRIARWRGYYQHYRKQCLHIHIHIDRMSYKRLRDEMLEDSSAANNQVLFGLAERQSLTSTVAASSDVQIEEVIGRKVEAGKAYFVVKVFGQSDTIDIEESALKGNVKAIHFLQKHKSSLLLSQIIIPNPIADTPEDLSPSDNSIPTPLPDPCLPSTQPPPTVPVRSAVPSLRPNTRSWTRQKTTSSQASLLTGNLADLENSPEVEPHRVYEVEAILDFKFSENNIGLWKIKWVGYEETTWEPEEHLLTCLDLLNDFNHIHEIVVQKPPSAETIVEPAGKKASHAKQPKVITLSRNLDRLKTLLDIPRLQRELVDLTEARSSFKPKAYFSNSNTNTMVSTWTNHNHIHSMLGSYVNVLSDDQCSVSGIYISRLLHSLHILPGLATDSQKLAVILNAQHWEMCRSLMVVFNWYRDSGPKTAKAVLDVHRSKGYKHLKEQSPMLADFVDHVVWYVYKEQIAWKEDRRTAVRQKRQKQSRLIPLENDDAEQTVNCSKFGTCPSDPRSLPCDLYGLQQNILHNKPIELKPLHNFNGGDDELYTRCRSLIQAIWTDELVIPCLKQIDTAFSSSRRQSADNKYILDRCLTRGAILQCIADACGTDAIFASTAIKEFLASPALVFEGHLKRDEVFAKKAVDDAVTTLEPLFNWLKDYIKESPNMLDISEQIGNLTHLNMLELAAGRPLLLDQTQTPSQSSNIAAIVPNTHAKSAQRKQRHIFTEVSLLSLIPGKNMVGVGALGLIVREALAAHRKFRTTDEVLRRVLEGQHATRSTSSSHNPDHTNPIRQHSLGAQLLYSHLPAAKLTSDAGLANLLSWLGTGQGFSTQSFLKMIESNGFYANDVEAMVNKFQQAVSANWYHVEQQRQNDSSERHSTSRLPELIVTHDRHIWGQASNHLALLPTYQSGIQRGKKYTLDDKFNQYFTSAVHKQWKIALGDMLYQDPSTYSGERRSWGYYLTMVKDLNIPGFQQGLTVFQLANYLVFLGIAAMPHWTEIADFISGNRQGGAFRCLEKLGFHMTDITSVRAAFYCVHHHLDTYLTEEDKGILGFSPIFSEHLLSKVIRWAKHLETEGGIDLYEKGIHAENTMSSDWQARLNQTNNIAFPFPLMITSEELNKSILNTDMSFISTI